MKKNIYKSKQLFDPWKELKQLKLRLFFLLILIISWVIYGFSWLFLWFIISIEVFIKNRKKGIKEIAKQILISTAFLIGIMLLFKLFGLFGVIGIALIPLFFAAYIIYIKRKMFMRGMRAIEMRIWGRTLDKKNWKKDELKQIKYKVRI